VLRRRVLHDRPYAVSREARPSIAGSARVCVLPDACAEDREASAPARLDERSTAYRPGYRWIVAIAWNSLPASRVTTFSVTFSCLVPQFSNTVV
jgi:hypothetical protein